MSPLFLEETNGIPEESRDEKPALVKMSFFGSLDT
jgi:hypothetical protein